MRTSAEAKEAPNSVKARTAPTSRLQSLIQPGLDDLRESRWWSMTWSSGVNPEKGGRSGVRVPFRRPFSAVLGEGDAHVAAGGLPPGLGTDRCPAPRLYSWHAEWPASGDRQWDPRTALYTPRAVLQPWPQGPDTWHGR